MNQTMKDLQQIKDEVSQEWGHTDWNDFGESFKHRLGSAHAERDEVVTEIAIRYAQEQKRELVEMLEITRQMCIKRQFPSENELKEMAKEIKQLIKQATEG